MSDNNTNLYLDSLISEHDNELWKAGILSQVASAIASIATFTLVNINWLSIAVWDRRPIRMDQVEERHSHRNR